MRVYPILSIFKGNLVRGYAQVVIGWGLRLLCQGTVLKEQKKHGGRAGKCVENGSRIACAYFVSPNICSHPAQLRGRTL